MKKRKQNSCHLEEYKVYLPKRFTTNVDNNIIKDLNKNENLCLIYKWLKEKKYPLVELKITNLFLYNPF